jgi:hypothetical protein
MAAKTRRKTTSRRRTTTRTIKPKKKGQKPLKFKQGALTKQLGRTKSGTIPKKKMAKAAAGGYGPKAKKRALFARNVLKGGRRKKRR